jgi:hypothetical protein
MAGEGTLRLMGSRGRPIRLRIVLVPIIAPLTFEVLLAGKELGVFTATHASQPTIFLTVPFSVEREDTITIRSVEGCFEPAHLLGGFDTRCVSASFQTIGVIEMSE